MNCEITCLDIKCSQTDSLKMLIFKFSKADKGDKKKGDEMAIMYHDEPYDTDYSKFK